MFHDGYSPYSSNLEQLNSLRYYGQWYHSLVLLVWCSCNVVYGEKENRMLLTGLHTVVDVACKGCRSSIGWHYIHAYEHSEAYKIGMFVLEKVWLAKSDVWDVKRSRTCPPLLEPRRTAPRTSSRSQSIPLSAPPEPDRSAT